MKLGLVRCLAIAAAGTLALTACGSGTPDTDNVVYANWGGDAATAAEKGWLTPWSETSGATFELDSPVNNAKITAMVDADRVTWDLATMDITTAGQLCDDGYLVKRDPTVDMSAFNPDRVTDDCMIPIWDQSVALVYNKDVFGDNPPTSITDFMDRDKFPGKRLVRNYPLGSAEALLLADGTPSEQLYPLDFTRVSSALDSLGGDLVLVPSQPDLQQRLENGDFAMCLCVTARAANSVEQGANLGVVWDKSFAMWDGMYGIAKSRVPDLQQSFLSWLSKPENQAGFTEFLPLPPATEDQSAVKVDSTQQQFIRPADSQTTLMDVEWYSTGTNATDATEKWTAATTR